jgi:hypothetical protein
MACLFCSRLELQEHNKPGGGSVWKSFGWMVEKSGWRALWDMFAQIFSVAERHGEVDDYYRDTEFMAAREDRRGSCW